MILLPIDKAILESLYFSMKTLENLSKDIGVKKELVKNSLKLLIEENAVLFDGQYYQLSKIGESIISSVDEGKTKLKDEAIDLFKSLVQSPMGAVKQSNLFNLKGQNFRCSKVWLDSFEEKILLHHLKNLEDFFEGVEISNKKKGQVGDLKNKKLFIWGGLSYGESIKNSLTLDV